jgi:hypothetical protein
MFIRLLLVGCLALASWPVAAQPGSGPIGARIRIRGLSAYQTQGAMVESSNDAWNQFRQVDGRTLTIPRQVITGRVISSESDIVTLMPDDHADAIHIPVAAIAQIDVSQGRRGSRARAIVVGTAVGVGGFFVGIVAGVAMCASLDCAAAPIQGFATGGLLGAWTGAHLAGERWERTTVGWLSQPVATP